MKFGGQPPSSAVCMSLLQFCGLSAEAQSVFFLKRGLSPVLLSLPCRVEKAKHSRAVQGVSCSGSSCSRAA